MNNIDAVLQNSEIQERLLKIDKLFEHYFLSEREEVWELLQFFNLKSGKGIRPLFLLLSAELSGECREVPYFYAMLLEVLHMASLVHDDIVDDAGMRRGKASFNRQYGNQLAVLAGDYLLSRSLVLLSERKEDGITKLYAGAAEKLCRGEIMEQVFNKQEKYTLKDYLKVLRLKTGSLFSACCEIGVITGRGDQNLQKKMSEFGEYFGIAFQIKDDLMDFLEDSNHSGKEPGQDMGQKIFTAPLLSIISDIKEKDKERLLSAMAEKDRKTVQSLIEQYSGFEKTMHLLSFYNGKCRQILQLMKNQPAVSAFYSFLDFNEERRN